MSWTAFGLVLAGLAIAVSVGIIGFRGRRAKQRKQLHRAEDELHPLLKDFTTFRSFTTRYAFYPRIRTFYRPHSHKGKHQDIEELPLLVFVHGLGGVLPMFAPMLHSLTNIGACFGIELPGHGRSAFSPTDYGAYTIEANAALWKTAIELFCEEYRHRSVVLISHSMGCSISVLLASGTSTVPTLSLPVLGMVAICPRGRVFTEQQIKNTRRLAWTPDVVIEILRWLDRYGGENSASVHRVVGKTNELDLKRMQLQWNRQSRTSVVKRVTLGLLPLDSPGGQGNGGWPSQKVWKGMESPLFLLAGESDHVTPPVEIENIIENMTNESLDTWKAEQSLDTLKVATNVLMPTMIRYRQHGSDKERVIQAIIFPAPAAHAFLYAHATYRLVSALTESFLADHVDNRLDFAYQLQLLTRSGKWDVKNLQKWKAVLPVSGPIDISSSYGSSNGLFRALKTMREQDDEHTPVKFLQRWAEKIYAVIDISHDIPVYNTKNLENGGVRYLKFPCVSKVPPTPVEVQDYCSLVDKLIAERDAKEGSTVAKRAIATHCHYGYNRTGFFICAYLITRCGYTVPKAIDEFARAKPPGIKHEHFLDVLWLRFANHTQTPLKSASSRALRPKTKQDQIQKTAEDRQDKVNSGNGNMSEGDLM